MGRVLLFLAGLCSLGVALLHVAFLMLPSSASAWFGADQWTVDMLDRGAIEINLLIAGLAAVFLIWAYYGFAGAGIGLRPPLLRLGLSAIAAIYILRGLLIVKLVGVAIQHGAEAVPFRFHAFSLVAMAIGLLYLVGLLIEWRRLAPPPKY